MSLRLVSFNMQNRLGELPKMRTQRLESIAALLETLEPDIVCLQEAILSDYKRLRELLEPSVSVFTPRDDGESAGEGNPIFVLSKGWTQAYSETIWLSATPQIPSRSWRAAHHRIATILRLVNDAGQGLWMVNLHLDHRSALARRNSIALIRQHLLSLLEPESDEAILCGDFNMAAAHMEQFALVSKGTVGATPDAIFHDAALGFADSDRPTFRGIGPFHWFQARLDHCLHTPGLHATGYRVQEPEWERRMLSDHRPIIIDFERKKGQS